MILNCPGPYHIERDHIFEGYFAGLVLLDEMLVDQFWTAAGGQTQHEWLFGRWLERFNAICGKINIYISCTSGKEFSDGRPTDYIVRNISGSGLAIVSDDDSPAGV